MDGFAGQVGKIIVFEFFAGVPPISNKIEFECLQTAVFSKQNKQIFLRFRTSKNALLGLSKSRGGQLCAPFALGRM
jgi:hypothetical protein